MGLWETEAIYGQSDSILPIRSQAVSISREGRVLIDAVSVAIERKPQITVVIGPNGAGKSLLVRLLAGLVAPDSGAVDWNGRPPDRERSRGLGFVFQRPVMLRRTALANVAYPLLVAGVARQDAERIAVAELKRVGLEHAAQTFARSLSGGEQQRVALARALVLRPEALFLDEATSNLDPASTLAMEARMKDFAARGGHVVLVTQDLAQARRVAEVVLFMHRGRISECQPALAFFEDPSPNDARRFLAGELLV